MASRINYRKDIGKYIVIFINPVDKTLNKRVDNLSRQEAIDKAKEWDVKYYAKHRSNIPTGITLDATSGRFRVYTRYGYVASYPTLMEAVECKQNMLSDLTEPKYLRTGRMKLINNE